MSNLTILSKDCLIFSSVTKKDKKHLGLCIAVPKNPPYGYFIDLGIDGIWYHSKTAYHFIDRMADEELESDEPTLVRPKKVLRIFPSNTIQICSRGIMFKRGVENSKPSFILISMNVNDMQIHADRAARFYRENVN